MGRHGSRFEERRPNGIGHELFPPHLPDDALGLGGFADVVEDLRHGAGIVDEGDDADLTVADWANQWQTDARRLSAKRRR